MTGAIDLDNRGLVIACPACGQKNRLAYERLADSLRCGKCKQPVSAPSTPIDVHSSEDFDRLIAHASLPIVVDYWAPWCGPCRQVGPVLDAIAAEYAGQVGVVKLNTDENPESMRAYGVMMVPTINLFSGGEVVKQVIGARSKSALLREFAEFI